MKAQRAIRLTTVLLTMVLVGGCRKVEEGDTGPVGPGSGGDGSVGSISVVASPAAILGNGSEASQVTATITDVDGNPVEAGVSVSFSASRGSITASALTDATGRARAVYTSSRGAGEARINVQSGSASGYVTITLTAGAPAQIVIQSVERLTIGIRGTDIPQSSTMTFQVRDAQGIPVGAGTTVEFTLAALTNGGAGSGESLEPASDITDEDGFVRTVLLSGTLPGITETVGRITSTNPDIVSLSVRISINTGLPVAANLTVAATECNIPGLCFFNVQTEILGLAYDQFHNPVPSGTTIYFTSEYAGIQPTDTTDDHGIASVWLISARELPPVWPGPLSGEPAGFPYGFVKVWAQTADTGGVQIRDSTYVLFSGCTILDVDTSPFVIADGTCQSFPFNVWDQNHNPLSEGTSITVESTAGILAGDIDVTLDCAQFGNTSFIFALCDDDPNDTDPPISVSVTIKVTSRNGNATVTILGTID